MESESPQEPEGDGRLAFLKAALGAGLAFWAVGLGLSLANVFAGMLFPEAELAAVEADVPRLRDAPAPLSPSPSAPRPLPLESLLAPGVPATSPAAPAPEAPAASPALPAEPALEAGEYDEPLPEAAAEPSRRPGFASTLAASAGPAVWAAGGASFGPAAAKPGAAEPAEPGPSIAPPAAAASRRREKEGRIITPKKLPAGSEDDEPRAGAAEATDSAQRILAAAGIPATGAGALTPFPGGSKGLIATPATVQAAGGRLGQGGTSMENGQGATPATFDPDAKGLESSPGKTPPGPVLKAGSAPAIPSSHVPFIAEAARSAGIDPALLAATAARESNFRDNAYRAEPHLNPVQWRKTPSSPKEKYFDGSIGPTQVLRSNFLARGIDNDREAYDLKNNYRISAGIIKSNLNAFPGNLWKGVAAYNVGQYGAKIGRVPANNYTDTILAWRKDYARALAPYVK